MGRAILIVFLSLAGIIFVCNQWITADTNDENLEPFVEQYRYLVFDGKYDLAEKMLDNRYQELENYYEEKSLAHKQTFAQLAGNTNQNPEQIVHLLNFLDLSISPDEEKLVKEKLKEIQILAENSDINRTDVLEKWTSLSSFIELYFPQEKVHYVNEALQSYHASSSLETQQSLLYYLDYMIPEDEKDNTHDAFIWTAIIIGGSIIGTLFYVGYRKYKAEKELVKEKQTRKQNS
ncbi:sporulation protein YpjB [Halobacillus sp. B23F22_1]|uniref:sporulation protein YpjB n=1 Tax=Halobacillus sp. B23F22_1 TaxID=3459514 RepID=UPI00373F7AD1